MKEKYSIPHNCHFWYATTFFRPVKGTPKKCLNLRQNCLSTKQRESIFWNANSHFSFQLFQQGSGEGCILGVLFDVLGVLFGVLGVLFGIPGVLVGVLGV